MPTLFSLPFMYSHFFTACAGLFFVVLQKYFKTLHNAQSFQWLPITFYVNFQGQIPGTVEVKKMKSPSSGKPPNLTVSLLLLQDQEFTCFQLILSCMNTTIIKDI